MRFCYVSFTDISPLRYVNQPSGKSGSCTEDFSVYNYPLSILFVSFTTDSYINITFFSKCKVFEILLGQFWFC